MVVKSDYESDQVSRRFLPALKFACSLLLLISSLVVSIAETPPEVTVDNSKLIDHAAGAVINRELTASAKELIEITLSPGDLLRLSLEKGDLALSLGLYDPLGQKLLERVSYGYETLDLSVPAEASHAISKRAHSG